MFSTKIRTTIATLAATFAVALPLVAAGPAGAKPISSGSHAGPGQKKDGPSCQKLQSWYQSGIEGAVQIDGNPDGKNPDDDAAAQNDAFANMVRDKAKRQGCSWAA